MTSIRTTYLGYEIVVYGSHFVVLDRDGEPIETPTKLGTMSTVRKFILRLRREEQAA